MIGKILKTMRKINNFKQSDISEKTNIPQNTLSQYENEIIQPTFETIKKIADVCNFKIIFENETTTLTPDNISRKEI